MRDWTCADAARSALAKAGVVAFLYFGVVWPAVRFPLLLWQLPTQKGHWPVALGICLGVGWLMAGLLAIPYSLAVRGSWKGRRYLSRFAQFFGFLTVTFFLPITRWDIWLTGCLALAAALAILEPRFHAALNDPAVKRFVDDRRDAKSFLDRYPADIAEPPVIPGSNIVGV